MINHLFSGLAKWDQDADGNLVIVADCAEELPEGVVNEDGTRYDLMHLAEDMLMDTGCICPLYFYTDIYMLDDSVQGFYSNPLGYKYFLHCTYAAE